MVNILFGGLPSRRVQKATRREVMSIEPAVLTLLRWSEVPISFSRADQWTSFSEPGRFPLILKPVVAGSKLNKVLIDGGSVTYGPLWAHFLGGYQDRLLGGALGLPGLCCTTPDGVEHKDYGGEVLG
jgi:hypothetical protein